MKEKRTVRNLVIFTVVVLASGWLGYGLDRLMNNTPSGQQGLADAPVEKAKAVN